MPHHADVLIVTVTDVESQAVMEVFREATGKSSKPESSGDGHYLDLGEIKGSRVFMALSGMGAGGIGGAQESIRRAIDALSPDAVIMVGIAFGVDEQKQEIGDVLLSERLMLYDLQRRGTDADGKVHIIPRGDRPSAAPRLVNWLRVADLQWKQAEIRRGLVLSGEHLVDNVDHRAELLGLEEEAIGGEMEGAGLYVACQNGKVDWVLVKAICDWADGKKEVDRKARQEKAAHNAAAFVLLHCSRRRSKRSEGRFHRRPRSRSSPANPSTPRCRRSRISSDAKRSSPSSPRQSLTRRARGVR
jgi:nucleoside phosphorylase